MEKTCRTIDDYISQCPPEVQGTLQELRSVIKEEAPESAEKISWGMPTFVYHGNLVHFAAHKNHIGFYPGESGISSFKDALSEYKSSKGAVQFPYTRPLPLQLIREIVRFRAAENAEIAEKKKKPKPL
ncbi:DUF1801 domain-containing protein [Hydrogenoanaerobacterium sp.]|uniref:iron chaperone n=1 Tax=Hydrogenoanaerobacterium sp. TaxID=2953763 RepID=UPI002897104F|nr:DUF1801 domain-containing protein [Hydrogenoanaerobacterium sp.]